MEKVKVTKASRPMKIKGEMFEPEQPALCADPLVDPEWFFNEPEYQLAKIICDQCPVKLACGQWAINNNEQNGVWGGLTPDERHKLKKKRR